ncbi:DUF1707 domain-containing protein [Mycobacterium cookii]|uniref:DUF1707 domain-containing protein n=1 Tax=Nocardioides furvisabuli TaxID=375542 RepID=A0ABP5JDQ6_9ACTN|nr:DUF1707 domain-containing protein [Nocardioides furvisabuli]
MRGFRAKDSDRDRFVELIEAAYVDGQLGAVDRDLRVSRALSAETLDELQTLTRDLRPPPGGLPAVAARTPAYSRRLLGVLLLLGAVVAMLGLGVAGLVLFASVDTGSETSPSVAVESAQAEPAPRRAGAEPSFEMNPAGVRGFVRAYERRFGTLDVYEVGLYPARVGVRAPVRGSRPRMERWTWDGEWRQDSDASAVRGPDEIIDLGSLDVRRLFANITTARRTLEVPGAELTHVLVDDGSRVPTVDIHVANAFDESGYLTTTLEGDVLRAHPYRA